MNLKRASLKKLAVLIASYLAQNGVETVLTGGACVSLYSRNKYQSYDLDFVLLDASQRKRVGPLLSEVGFRPDGRHFRHKDTKYIVEFLYPPLSVGEEPVRHPAEIRLGGGLLKLLSPTDCIKDRLAAFYHWDDRQALEQALLVAKDHPFDVKDVARWSKVEGMAAKFRMFARLTKMRAWSPN